MRYITPCTEAGLRVPPGADHKEKMMAYRMAPGVAWLYDPLTGSNTAVEVRKDLCDKTGYLWSSRWADGRTVEDFSGPDGCIYSQPACDDPRAKDKALGGTGKRAKSRFMASVQKARAEEAERQGKTVAPATKPRKGKAPRKIPELL